MSLRRLKTLSGQNFYAFVLYYIYGHVRAIPTYRVYRLWYYISTIVKIVEKLVSENDLQSLKYLLNHCSSSAFMSGHPYSDFIYSYFRN